VHDRSLAAGFGRRIVVVDPATARGAAAPADADIEWQARSLADLGPLRGRIDVLLAVDTLVRDDLARFDEVLDQTLRCLTEGGLLAATFPAAPRAATAREVRLRVGTATADRALHEVELQYRLRRAGFRGVRILRLEAADGVYPESLLCLAVRRANN
jgi:hypothetical protein